MAHQPGVRREANPFEVEDSASAPARVTGRHHALGRLVNALPESSWWDHTPLGMRPLVLSSVREHLLEGTEEMFGPSICDGTGTDCAVEPFRSGCYEFLTEQADPHLRRLLRFEFHAEDVAVDVRSAFPEAGDLLHRILGEVSELEHRWHVQGIRLSHDAGRAFGRHLLSKYCLLLYLAFHIPLSGATVVTDVSQGFHEGFQGAAKRLLTAARPVFDPWCNYVRWFGGVVDDAFPSINWETTHSYRPVVMKLADFKELCTVRKHVYPDCFRASTGFWDDFLSVNPDVAVALPYHERELRPAVVREIAHDTLFVAVHIVLGMMLMRLLFFWYDVAHCTFESLLAAYSGVSHWFTARRVRNNAANVQFGHDSDAEKPQTFIFEGLTRKLRSDILEMDVPGSDTRPSVPVNGAVAIMRACGNEVDFLGMGFRYQDYLITAGHVRHATIAADSSMWVAPFRERGGKSLLDVSSMLKVDNATLEEHDIGVKYLGSLDISIVRLDNVFWTKLRVKSLAASDAMWGHTVCAYGLRRGDQSQTLQRSVGTVLKTSDADDVLQVRYNASTIRGWSGCPVMSNGRVVAVHLGTNGEYNHGLNMAVVRLAVAFDEHHMLESNNPSLDPVLKSFRAKNGKLARRHQDFYFDFGEESFRYKALQSDRGLVSFADYDEVEEQIARSTMRQGDFTYEGENVLGVTVATQNTQPQVLPTPVPQSPTDKLLRFGSDSMFHRDSTKSSEVSSPYVKIYEPVDDTLLDLDRAKQLGYEPDTFALPDLPNRKAAIHATKKHMDRSLRIADKQLALRKQVSPEIRAKAKVIIGKMLSKAAVTAEHCEVSVQSIVDQVNSSAVGDSRSPGLPYIAQGIQTNADLFAKFDPKEWAERVCLDYKNGSLDHPSVNMAKIEVMKKQKLAEQFCRVVQGVSVDQQVVTRCLLGALGESVKLNYRSLPIACGFSPLKQGDGEWLISRHTKRAKSKNFVFDLQNCEFTAHTPEAMSDVTDIMLSLIKRPSSWSTARYEEKLEEIESWMDVLNRMSNLFGDGTVVHKREAAVLASGRWDTFLRNSLTVLYWEVVVLLEMGYSQDDISRKFILTVGGDDSLTTVPEDFDPKAFIDILNEHGPIAHKEGTSPLDQPFEFFSWRFSRDESGSPTWVPTRFTKHVETLRYCPAENRAQSILSHMANWVHSKEVFTYFEDMYTRGVERGEPNFELGQLPDRGDLLAHLWGSEGLSRSARRTKQFLTQCCVALEW